MTYRDRTVGVVIPAYNEEPFVGEVIRDLPSFVDRVYVIDDRSTDGTWEEIVRAATEVNGERPTTDPFDETVVPLRHDVNRGVGAAMITGYEAALADDLDLVASIDGDGQMDPGLLPHLFDPVVEGRAAYAKGDRLARREFTDDMSRWRLFGNRTLTVLTRITTGYWELRDPQNGYTVISGEALQAIELDDLYDGYGFTNDILVQLNTHGFRVADVPHPAVYGDEESDISYSSFIPQVSWLLLERWWGRIRKQSQGGELLTIGLVAGIVAIVAGVWGIARWLIGPTGHAVDTPLVQGVLQGLVTGSRPDYAGAALLSGLLLCGVSLYVDTRRNSGCVVREPQRDVAADRPDSTDRGTDRVLGSELTSVSASAPDSDDSVGCPDPEPGADRGRPQPSSRDSDHYSTDPGSDRCVDSGGPTFVGDVPTDGDGRPTYCLGADVGDPDSPET